VQTFASRTGSVWLGRACVMATRIPRTAGCVDVQMALPAATAKRSPPASTVWRRSRDADKSHGVTCRSYSVSIVYSSLDDFYIINFMFFLHFIPHTSHQFIGWLGSRVVSVLDSGAEGPGYKSQSRRCRVTALGKLFTPIVPLFTKQQNC